MLLPGTTAEWDWIVRGVPCQDMGCCALFRHVLVKALVGTADTDFTWL